MRGFALSSAATQTPWLTHAQSCIFRPELTCDVGVCTTSPSIPRDLLTDEPFTRKDVITIQNPLDTSARTLNRFDHVVKGIRRAKMIVIGAVATEAGLLCGGVESEVGVFIHVAESL